MRAFAPLLALAACTPAPRPLTAAQLEVYPDAQGMPADVQDFIVRHSDCSHWLGEDGTAPERRRQIERAIRVSCPGLDADARRLRARYAAQPEISARLRDYEELGQ